MDRKLLPYEHQLIEALGVTKEEYLNFVDIQQEYQDPKAGTKLDIRNDTGVVAIVLTVVGILFQVGAALLTPKPQIPDIDTAKNQRRSREQRFAPTFGFNSAQELASYGDPINLVYTNTSQNPNGGVRVAGSLVWSGIENFGSTQFIQLLLVLGASRIRRIKEEYTAFGQVGLQDFDPALVWMFYKQNDGRSGAALFDDIVFGYPTGKQNAGLTEQLKYLPPRLKDQASNAPVCRILTHNRGYQQGFSQAYSPTTASAFGAYDPVPIFVKYFGRDEDGDEEDAPNRITVVGNNWGGTREGDLFRLRFEKRGNEDEDIRRSMDDTRERLFETIDYGGTYLLGSAKYALEFKSPENIANSDVECRFRCIQDGNNPFTFYTNDEDSDRQLIKVDLTKLIAARNALEGNRKYSAAISIVGLGVSYDFSGSTQVTWKDENNISYTVYIPRSGSIKYTERQQKKALADPKKLLTDQERRRLKSSRKDLKAYRRRINKGVFDDISKIEREVRQKVRNNTRMKIQKQKKKDKQKIIRDAASDFVQNKISRSQKNRISTSAREDISQIEEIIIELENRFVAEVREQYIAQVEDNEGSFTGLDGKTYPYGGLDQIENALQESQVASSKIIDQIGQDALNDAYETLLDEKDEALEKIKDVIKQYKKQKIDPNKRNKNFYTKCLVKSESASYETISAVDLVKFSIKSTIFRRIAGRQKQYGEEKVSEYKTNDNGVHARVAFFEVSYKEVNSDGVYKKFPFIFAVRSGTESDVYNQLNFEPSQSGTNRKRWQFKFDPVIDIMADRVGPSIGLIADSGSVQSETHQGNTWWWRGEKLEGLKGGYPLIMDARGPELTNQVDMFSAHSDTQYQFSFERGPEFTLSAVTEQQIATTTSERNALQYDNCTTMAMIVRAGRGIQDLRNITTFVQKGKRCFTVKDFENKEDDSSSYAPDIFVDTALDKDNGVGKYIRRGSAVLDQDSLKLAKNFCKNNNLPTESGGKINLFMDGVIADATSWREFWVANGPFSLLELARKNGRDTLVPAVPVNSDGRAAQNDGTPVPVGISALFTTGNILEGTYKEEFLDYGTSTEELNATVIYRDLDEGSVFPRKATVEVRAKNITDSDAIRETFDASAYVTQREQAIMIGKLLVNQRRFILRGIEFKTFPSRAPLEPGAFIYVDIGNTSWDRYSSGVVMEGGDLNSPLHDQISDGSYSFLLYDSATGETVSRNSVSVSNNSASSLSSYKGWMYVMGEEKPSKRVFRITEVAFDEEGEVTVKAMEYPVYDDLGAKIADFRSSQFDVS